MQCQSDDCNVITDASNYVMMELVEFSDPGFVVLLSACAQDNAWYSAFYVVKSGRPT